MRRKSRSGLTRRAFVKLAGGAVVGLGVACAPIQPPAQPTQAPAPPKPIQPAAAAPTTAVKPAAQPTAAPQPTAA
ncbi:MAG: twin-arginine translocation signal domain-containing protein, partial [Chloroflexi bacterium]|nr:twin-arginine translocation signal domain-containing protein [Chloroflexota bacterium]